MAGSTFHLMPYHNMMYVYICFITLAMQMLAQATGNFTNMLLFSYPSFFCYLSLYCITLPGEKPEIGPGKCI